MQMTATSEQRCSDFIIAIWSVIRKRQTRRLHLLFQTAAMQLLILQTKRKKSLPWQYGTNLALAHQLIDDILDLTAAKSASLGKSSLTNHTAWNHNGGYTVNHGRVPSASYSC
ncbi:Solanesyl diphosphate synthase [Melia azedarach]|uniref:Solanesyl diphosphate synthase n=1 Tax=Melia azedarach TaxID=155640 RepID=A0ACC1WYR2_MELAZ|nr:Solanesyl diphosphate synthase [Melia azedarach]